MESLDQKRADAVAEIHARALQRWPAIAVDPARLSQAVDAAVDGGVVLESLHGEDLYLVLGCLDRQPEALAAFEREIISVVRPAVERSCADASDADDALQSTREKLLLGPPPAQPKLAQYTGRGALAAWVRVVAVREALQATRKSKHERVTDDVALLEGASSAASLELSMLKDLHAASFRNAVQGALRRLTTEQRALLRFHVKDGLTIDQLGPLLGIHRATAARRLEKARADALEHTRAILREEHGLSDTEAQSLCRALGNDVDVSISRALADEDVA